MTCPYKLETTGDSRIRGGYIILAVLPMVDAYNQPETSWKPKENYNVARKKATGNPKKDNSNP